MILTLRWGVAIALIVAGVLKSVDPQAASHALLYLVRGVLTGHQTLWLVSLVASVEVAVGLALAIWPRSRLPVAALLALLAAFTAVQIRLAGFADAPSCGCFGSLTSGGSGREEAVAGIARNIGLGAVAFMTATWTKRRGTTPRLDGGAS
ncbi:MAG TPA: MauE/DoxX family redox-associated membrane protein [Phycisphaerales bacterium]|nr:MauE/DoxX family redox-associated membrane protein [Phycisphaerales bacterium]